MNDDQAISILTDIRNWVRAASFAPVKKSLEQALPDAKSRSAYQMFDGSRSMDQIRVACKLSPNSLVSLAQKWVAMGLMEIKADKRRIRLFDLADFDLLPEESAATKGSK